MGRGAPRRARSGATRPSNRRGGSKIARTKSAQEAAFVGAGGLNRRMSVVLYR